MSPSVLVALRGFDDDVERFAIGHQAHAIGALLGQNLVQGLIGFLDIKFEVLGGQLLVVEGGAFQRGSLVGLGLANEDGVDDLLAVDRVGHADAEIFVAEDLALLGVLVRHVEVDDFLVIGGVLQVEEGVIALLLVVEQHRLVGVGVEVAHLVVDFAVGWP